MNDTLKNGPLTAWFTYDRDLERLKLITTAPTMQPNLERYQILLAYQVPQKFNKLSEGSILWKRLNWSLVEHRLEEAVKTEQPTILSVADVDGKCKISNGDYERLIEINQL